MKKISLVAAAFAMIMTFASCSNGSDDDDDTTIAATTTATAITSNSNPEATTTTGPLNSDSAAPTFEANTTYRSANSAFGGTRTITVKMTSATAGTISDGGDDKPFTIDPTTGALTYTGSNGDTQVSHILKVGEKIYAAGNAFATTSASLYTTWDSGAGMSVTINENGSCTIATSNGNMNGTYTYSNNLINATVGENNIFSLYAGNKLFNKYAELTNETITVYKSADSAFDGTRTITVEMTSATAGTISDGNNYKPFTIDPTTGELTYTGSNGDTKVSHILKVGEKIYALGSPSVTTSSALVGTWDCGAISLTFNANDTVTFNGNTAAYTIVDGLVTADFGEGDKKYLIFAGSKLFFKYSELTKQ